MNEAIGQILSGASIASILLLVALGLAIIYGTMGVINLAHGDFLMVGAYVTWFIQTYLGVGIVIELILVFISVAALGWLCERSIIRFLYRRPLDTMLATWGLGLILKQAIRLGVGPRLRYVKIPPALVPPVHILGTTQASFRVFIFGLTVAILIATYLLIYRTRFGMRVRAVTQNPEIAKCFGINASQVYALTFAYGCGLAGLAGALVAPIKSVYPDMGLGFVVNAFMVVVMGGVQTLFGTVASAAILGELSGWLAFVLDDTIAQVIVFTLIIVVIRFRPEGLFTLHVRRA
ncbi:MAG: urea ABC transporter permease subunit UrtB [Chloroflexota bacterium]